MDSSARKGAGATALIGATGAFACALLEATAVAGPWPVLGMASAVAAMLGGARIVYARSPAEHTASRVAAPAPSNGHAVAMPATSPSEPMAPARELVRLQAELEKYRRTELELVEAKQIAEAAIMAKGEFLATMSHEIRTPLNGIIPLLDILLGTRLEADQREYVRTAFLSARQLLRIVDDILDYSKLEAGKLTLETVGLNLRETLDAVMRLMEKNAEAKGLKLSLSIDPSVRLAVRGDPVRLRQVLTNLVSNALKFTDRGMVNVNVMRKGETRTHHELRFEVHDTGVGIAPDAAAKLFQPFSQADASTTRVFGGTGLGLVICKRIIDLMGGRIGVESTPGRGSLFWFEIPLLKALGDLDTRRRELSGARALVIGIEPALMRRMSIALPNWGVLGVPVPNTAEALARLRGGIGRTGPMAFDVVIADLVSTRVTAVALVRNLQRETGAAGLSFLWLSGDEPVPPELADLPRSAVVPRNAPEPELRQALLRLIESGAAEAADPRAPAQAVIESIPDLPDGAVSTPPARLQGRVLLVEDNPVNRLVAQRLLGLMGLQITAAENGREALERMEAETFDVVLMDCQMPVMDGYAATRERRRREASGEAPVRLPILAMTANAMVGDREKCLDAGMDEYLSKPLNRARLEALLRRFLAGGADHAALAPTSDDAPAAPASAEPTARAAAPTPAAVVTPFDRARARMSSQFDAPAPPAAPPASSTTEADAGADTDDADPIDHGVTDELRDVMGAEFDALVRVFLDDAPSLLLQLEVAAHARDLPAMAGPAHTLKSTSANLGALRVSALARDIEHGARTRTLDNPDAAVQRLNRAFQRATEALRAMLG